MFEPYKYALPENYLTQKYLLPAEGIYGCNKEKTIHSSLLKNKMFKYLYFKNPWENIC